MSRVLREHSEIRALGIRVSRCGQARMKELDRGFAFDWPASAKVSEARQCAIVSARELWLRERAIARERVGVGLSFFPR